MHSVVLNKHKAQVVLSKAVRTSIRNKCLACKKRCCFTSRSGKTSEAHIAKNYLRYFGTAAELHHTKHSVKHNILFPVLSPFARTKVFLYCIWGSNLRFNFVTMLQGNCFSSYDVIRSMVHHKSFSYIQQVNQEKAIVQFEVYKTVFNLVLKTDTTSTKRLYSVL